MNKSDTHTANCYCAHCKCNRAFVFDCIDLSGVEKHRCVACGHLYSTIISVRVASDSPNQSNETRVGNWQSDPSHITTPRVQLWSQSGTMRGVISSELAVQLVNDGKHFVISCQAIGEV